MTNEKLGFPIVPDSIANQIGGDAHVIVAADLKGLDLSRLSKVLPEPFGCAREVLGSIGVAVISAGDESAGFITGVPEAATKKCIESMTALFGATTALEDNVYTLTAGDTKVSLVWKDGMLVISEVGHPVKPGPPDAAKRARIKQVPKDAVGWIVTGPLPKSKVTESLSYFQLTPNTFHVVVAAEGSEPGAAKHWLEQIEGGFKAGAAQKGITMDDGWFKLTEPTPTSVRLEADIPEDVFVQAAEKQ